MVTGRGARPIDPKPRDERGDDPARKNDARPKKGEPSTRQQVERMENEGGPPATKPGGKK